MFAENRKAVALIIFAVLLCVIVVNPSRNILYDDDFAYAWSVKELVGNHTLKISDWTSASLVFQVFWGAAFCLPFGFSFAAVNISTIVLAVIGLVFFFFLLDQLGFSLRKRLLSVLILFSSPLYFDFSFSFMTDIPYTSLMLVSLYFFVRALRENETKWWVLGSIFISLTFLTRQIAICIIGGLVLSFLVEAYQTRNVDWRKWILALGPVFCVITVYFLWLNLVHGPTWCQRHIAFGAALEQLSDLGQYFQLVISRLFLFSVFISIFLLPFIFPFVDGARAVLRKLNANKLIAVIWCGLMGGYAVSMIALEKKLYIEGMFERSILFSNIPLWLWKMFFCIAALCIGALGAYISILFRDDLIARIRKEAAGTIDPVYRFLLFSFALHYYLSIGHTFFWDDYIIPILPFMLIFLNRVFESLEPNLPVAAVLVICSLVLSVLNTRFRYDYSDMIWLEGNALIASGVKPENISASLAFNGWYNYETLFARAIEEIGDDKVDIFSWARYLNPVFFLLSNPEPDEGFEIKKTISYSTLGLERTIYVVEKTNPKTNNTTTQYNRYDT